MPKPKKETITQVVWDCGFGHKHTKECAAHACIEKNFKKMNPKPHSCTRKMMASLSVIDGLSFKAAAESVGRKGFTAGEFHVCLRKASVFARSTGFLQIDYDYYRGDRDSWRKTPELFKSAIKHWLECKNGKTDGGQ